jgi:hypothetical protein
VPGGDLTWLTQLGPSGLLALGVGLMFLGALVPRGVMRAAVQREQQVSDLWKGLYFGEVDRADRATEIVQQQTAAINRLTVAVEGSSPAATGRHHSAG